MATKIGHASQDERKKARGGAAGDQTKTEVYSRNWYGHPWHTVFRPKDATVAEKIAKAMEQHQPHRSSMRPNPRAILY